MKVAVEAMLYSRTGHGLDISEGTIRTDVSGSSIVQSVTCMFVHSTPSKSGIKRVFQAKGTACAKS